MKDTKNKIGRPRGVEKITVRIPVVVKPAVDALSRIAKDQNPVDLAEDLAEELRMSIKEAFFDRESAEESAHALRALYVDARLREECQRMLGAKNVYPHSADIASAYQSLRVLLRLTEGAPDMYLIDEEGIPDICRIAWEEVDPATRG